MPNAIDPNVLATLILGSGLGLALAGIAVRARLLDARSSPRRCASCGRLVKGRRCSCLDSP